MQNDKNKSNSRSRRVPSVEETTATITAEQDLEEAANLLAQGGKSATSKDLNQSSSSVNLEGSQDFSNDQSEDQGKYAAYSKQAEPAEPLVPRNCQKTDERTQRILDNLQRVRETRSQNHPLILDDLRELGMYGELSEDQNYVTMAFEDVHRLVTTMKMANVILNERVQDRRRAKIDAIKEELDAEHCPNVQSLLAELEKARRELTLTHSFQTMGDFEGIASTLEGSVLFETLLISRAMTWLASISLDPNLEARRGVLSVFSELRAAYASQKTLHELYFHLHDDRKLFEARVRGAMSDLGERVSKAATAPLGGAIQKRQNIANELKPIIALVEEMLEITNRSYGAALTASHMGHIAYEHNVTIFELREQLSNLKQEIGCWVTRSSQDATAAMILAEENVVMAKANQELRAQVQQLQADQRRQTEILNGLLTNTDFGLPTTVLNDAVPSGQALLDLLDLPGHYARLVGNLREPPANEQGRLSILAPTTLATRGDLIESIERQLSRPNEYDLNAANAYLNVAMSRASEAKRRGMAVYGPGRIPKRSIETIFRCEPSGLRNNLPSYLKAPVPIASNLTVGLMDDLQNRF